MLVLMQKENEQVGAHIFEYIYFESSQINQLTVTVFVFYFTFFINSFNLFYKWN